MIDLSVVIPAYNQFPAVLRLTQSLQHLASGRVQIEYLIQDDASPDINFTEYLGHAPDLKVERNSENLGFGENCNRGAKRARGRFLFFLNQDMWVHPYWGRNWDEGLLELFVAGVGVIGPRLLFPDGRLQSAGGIFDLAGQPVHRCLGYQNLDHPEINEITRVSWTTGAALCIPHELFDQVSGFDPSYGRGYFEDVDLCLKVRSLGFEIRYAPTPTFYHQVGTTGGSPTFIKNALLFKSRWVDTGKVQPDLTTVRERFWA